METQIKVPHTEYPKIARKRKTGKTLRFIAKPYNVTRERIRQILRDHFPEITAEVAGETRKNIRDRKREKETKLCACGCGTVIPKWKKRDGHWYPCSYWYPTRQYFPGHQGRNRVPYKRTPETIAKYKAARKRDWAAGKYDNKILKKTIIMRRKLWKILKEHPDGLTIKEIIEKTKIKKSTLVRWIRVQQYMKLDTHRDKGHGRPYIIKLAKEPSVNVEDEICSPYLNTEGKKKND